MPEQRTEDDKIDNPLTAEDYLLAAQAWATGKRSHNNAILSGTPFEHSGEALKAIAVADSAQAQAFAAVATAMFSKEADDE